jgi:asparagine N-glycosylation enzyme membrane subunit Stt3
LRRKLFFVLICVAVLVAALVLAYVFFPSSQVLRREYVGGKYQCRIEITGEDPEGFDVGRIFYVKNGVEHRGYWGENFRGTLGWIKNNTAESAVFLNWWDYGHMIVGYAERDSVSKNPSNEALVSVGDPSEFKELDDHGIIVDVAKALTATDENETLATMDEYNATYVLVAAIDGKGKVGWLFNFAGRNFIDYYNSSWIPKLPFDEDMYNELGKQIVLCRILSNAQIPGLTRVYSDGNFTICRRSS